MTCPLNLWALSATEMREGYLTGLFTPSDVVKSCFKRMREVEPKINSMTYIREAEALSEAVAADSRYRSQSSHSVLDGIPITIKDSILAEGMPATWGTKALASHISDVDEIAVERARQAGVIIMGKTNLCEFTLEGYTSNQLFGTTRNPWDTRLTPGGSSGGAVAGLAAGIVPLALGTDAGGSIRRPASHCGLIGIKPSIGSVPRDHMLPAIMHDFDVVGVLGRSAVDTKHLFDIIKGPAQTDWRSWAAHGAALRKRLEHSRPKILYCASIEGSPVDPEIRANCHKAAYRFEELGFCIEEGPLPFDLGFTTSRWPIIAQLGLARLFERFPDWRQKASSKYCEMAQIGASKPMSALWEVLEETESLRQATARCFDEFDYIITPSAASLPWDADTAYPAFIDQQATGPRSHAIFASWVNAAGIPAIALPAQPSAQNLPIGIQLVGPFGSDSSLLDAAIQYEAIAGKWHEWPLISV